MVWRRPPQDRIGRERSQLFLQEALLWTTKSGYRMLVYHGQGRLSSKRGFADGVEPVAVVLQRVSEMLLEEQTGGTAQHGLDPRARMELYPCRESLTVPKPWRLSHKAVLNTRQEERNTGLPAQRPTVVGSRQRVSSTFDTESSAVSKRECP